MLLEKQFQLDHDQVPFDLDLSQFNLGDIVEVTVEFTSPSHFLIYCEDVCPETITV
jgi:hypothetical protein